MRRSTDRSRGNHTHLSAFTLIELSIVLIIIGLLVGGVLAGRDLIEQAKLSSQVSQIRSYEQAYNTFKLKYGCIPGDCDNAADLLSGTTSGDGDKIIENASASSIERPTCMISNAANIAEQGQFFAQLSTARLVDGGYDGTWASGIGGGYPALAFRDGTGMHAASKMMRVGAAYYGDTMQLLETQDPQRKAILCLAVVDESQSGPDTGIRGNGVFTPLQAQSIDNKIDDGEPKSGRYISVRPWTGASLGDCTPTSPYDTYDVGEDRTSCDSIYILEN